MDNYNIHRRGRLLLNLFNIINLDNQKTSTREFHESDDFFVTAF